jgi:hypothetical protein
MLIVSGFRKLQKYQNQLNDDGGGGGGEGVEGDSESVDVDREGPLQTNNVSPEVYHSPKMRSANTTQTILLSDPFQVEGVKIFLSSPFSTADPWSDLF